MPKFRIYYTVTKAGYTIVEADTLEDAINKWDATAPGEEQDGGVVEYDPYTEEYFYETTKEAAEESHRDGL